MDLILFPTDKYYSYLKDYIKNHKFDNPIYVGYNFEEAHIVDLNYESLYDELQLKVALEYIKKFCHEHKEKSITVHLYTPDISYLYDDLDITQYLSPNIIKFNYIVKKCQRMWRQDFNEEWLKDKRIKYIIMQ